MMGKKNLMKKAVTTLGEPLVAQERKEKMKQLMVSVMASVEEMTGVMMLFRQRNL
jgi:hypothetical protein